MPRIEKFLSSILRIAMVLGVLFLVSIAIAGCVTNKTYQTSEISLANGPETPGTITVSFDDSGVVQDSVTRAGTGLVEANADADAEVGDISAETRDVNLAPATKEAAAASTVADLLASSDDPTTATE